jgi:HEPN domain-containing protein
MKSTTKDWLTAAEDDLIASGILAGDYRLTGLAIFHCQQCLEKCFKAVLEEKDELSIRSHDLLRLRLLANVDLSEDESRLLAIINEVYTDARYPGDLGLLPHGKPSTFEIEEFIKFSRAIFQRVKDYLT